MCSSLFSYSDMKIKVIREFRDKDDFNKVYSAGSEYEFEASRAANIISRGLGEESKPEPKVEKPKKQTKKTDDE